MMDENSHYQKLDKFSLLNSHFAFFDTGDYLADNLFIRHQVRVDFDDEYIHPDGVYRAILCHVRRWDEDKFWAAIKELPNKMLLCGHPDYLEFCNAMWKKIRDDKTKKEKTHNMVST